VHPLQPEKLNHKKLSDNFKEIKIAKAKRKNGLKKIPQQLTLTAFPIFLNVMHFPVLQDAERPSCESFNVY
jgi:hypothetical protein